MGTELAELREVAFPERIIDRHVGGNTTYARSLAAGLSSRGVRVGRIPAGRSAPLTALSETVAGLKTNERGRILHYSADTGPLLHTRQPSVVTVHGVASRWISTARTLQQERLWRFRVQRAISSTHAIVTVSKSSADDVSHVFDVDPARITTIYHGIEAARFNSPTSMPDRLREVTAAPYVLYLGNIEPRKNLVELVRAFRDPRLQRAGIRLLIAGKPAWNSDAAMREITAGPAHYLGFVNEQERSALMQNAMLFAFPSLYEGFGFPVLEAMAAGTPVLTSTRGSLAEVAGPALTFEDLTQNGISEALVAALEDPRSLSESAQKGTEWVTRFSWDESLAKHIKVYTGLLER